MPIQQHPIPQEVAGYKFRLIGDMTVKQFIWLASGILGGILFYSLPLPFFFKYPLAAITVGLGAGTAFIPIQGRPMDRWIIAFIRSIYSPTQYVWSKQSEDPEYSRGTKTVITPSVPKASVSSIPQHIPASPIPSPKVSDARPYEGGAPATAGEGVSKPSPTTTLPARPTVTPSETPLNPIAQTESKLPIPFTPTTPNTLVGMTLTSEGKILPGALVEIKLKNNTIRATKSNQLGQFLFAKSLENGLYQIVTEKETFSFDIYSIELTGQIIKPLKLQAKA